jgi:hypothetical protein
LRESPVDGERPDRNAKRKECQESRFEFHAPTASVVPSLTILEFSIKPDGA